MNLIKILPAWKQAMENGYIDNHPFSPLTVDDYIRRVTLFFSEYQELTLETFRKALRAIPIEQHGKYNKLYKAIVCFAKFLHQEGHPIDERLVVKNKRVPDELAALRRKAIRAPKQLTVSEANLNKLKQHCLTPFEELVITLLSSTGLRASEACALTLDACNFSEGYAFVQKGKGRKARKVPLSDKVIRCINQHIDWRCELYKPSDPILSHEWPKQIKRNDLNTALNEIGARVGVAVTPHALRRAFVTISHAKGVPLDHLRIICGHSDIKTTMGYCRTQEAEALESVRNVDI